MVSAGKQDTHQTIHHDYSPSLGDVLFDFSRKFISDPESLDSLLRKIAHFRSLLPFGARAFPELEKIFKPGDNSLPIIMSSPIMLAAGGNRSAAGLADFQALGFGGVVAGSATAHPSPGNPHRPRLRLLPSDRAMTNSMGLGNPGIDTIAHAVDFSLGLCHKRKLAVGISVAETPGVSRNDNMIEDILHTFRKAYRAADFVEINVSCPNTGDNRIDWDIKFLSMLLGEIMQIRKSLAPRKAVFVKLSPDMNSAFLDSVLRIVSDAHVTGLTLFNTFPGERSAYLKMATPSDQIEPVSHDGKKGGISGRTLYQNTLPAIRFIKKRLPGINLIACGGIDHGAKVLDLLEAGADVVQCYTVLAYRYNAVHKMNRELMAAMDQKGYKSVHDIPHSA